MQETIEAALSAVQRSPTRVVGCGRTDAGVHAADYCLHFGASEPLRDNWLSIMNRRLPDDIVFFRVWPVAANAHARYDAVSRTYEYELHTRPDPFLAPVSAHYPLPEFDPRPVEAALAVLTGHRDFRAFCLTPDRHNTTVCDLREATLRRLAGDRWRFRFVADRFLRGMIRILVGQLLEVGSGRLSVTDVTAALADGKRRRGRQAHPEGLFLREITYSEPPD